MKSKIILGLFLAIVMYGCCNKTYPIKTVEKEVVRTEYIEKFRTDTVEIILPQEIIEIVTKDTISHLVITGAISDAMIADGLLYHSLKTDPNYKPLVTVEIKEVEIKRDSIIYELKEIPIKMPLTKYQSTMINLGWAFIGLILCILIFIGYKIYRKLTL